MVGFKALGFGDARNVGMGRLCAVAGLAEDLKVMGFICATECEGQNMVNVPRLAGFDLLGAGCANAFPF
jgi:hypothetical protein